MPKKIITKSCSLPFLFSTRYRVAARTRQLTPPTEKPRIAPPTAVEHTVDQRERATPPSEKRA